MAAVIDDSNGQATEEDSAYRHIAATVEAQELGGDPPPEVLDWLYESFITYLYQGTPMDAAMGLSGKGGNGRGPRFEYWLNQRNAYLAQAFVLLEEEKRNATAADMAKSVDLFRSAAWLRWREMDSPPDKYQGYRRALFFAFRAADRSLPVPTTKRQITAILDDVISRNRSAN